MKRSEMVKLIVDVLFNGSLAARVDEKNPMVIMLAEKDAEDILNMIEKEGMLPPSFVKKLTDEESEAYGTNHCSYYTGNIRLNEWEEE